ncbi:MAG TPA: shikimate kinase [Bacteroidia bacterium]
MKVYLIGMPACGKTTIGKYLAEKTNATFIDLDEYIVAKERASIAQLFQEKGEAYFREIEHTCLKEIIETKPRSIVALGGGTPCFYNNLNFICISGTVFYLHAAAETIFLRIKQQGTERPLFFNLSDGELKEKIDLLLQQREVYYVQAHHHINTLHKPVDAIIEEINKLLNYEGKT